MKSNLLKFFICILTAASLLLFSSCAGRQLKAIPSPPPTSKLRVYVQPISAPFPYPAGAGQWDASHKGFVERQVRGIEQFLDRTGIYELVPEQDVQDVLGEQTPSYLEMTRNNWTLTKDIGKALFAEYVYVIERRIEKGNISGTDFYFTINLINTSSGKCYEASARLDAFDRANPNVMSVIIKKLYQTVFLSAKNDMFGTAIKKTEIMYAPDKNIVTEPERELELQHQVTAKQALPPEPVKALPKPESPAIDQAPKAVPETLHKPLDIQESAPAPELVTADPESEPPAMQLAHEPIPETMPSINGEPLTPPEPEIVAAIPEPEPQKNTDIPRERLRLDIPGIDRLVIYDLDAPKQYKTVALILTEVLREELFLLNRFILVNRENMLDVLREISLQQSGLIDEKQAVKAGKGLAANQVVTGSLGILGKTYLLQAKRIDVETFVTLGLASARFAKGEEEEVLSRLPGLAKSLAGVR